MAKLSDIVSAAFFLLLLFLDVHNLKTTAKYGLKAMDRPGILSILGLLGDISMTEGIGYVHRRAKALTA